MSPSDSSRGRGVFNDRRGVAAVEFALIFPIMATLLAGMISVVSFVQTTMTTKNAAYTIVDLVGRCRSVSDADVKDYFSAAAFILNSRKTMPKDYYAFVASVSFDQSTGAASVDWKEYTGTVPTSSSEILRYASSKGVKGGSVIVAGVYSSEAETAVPPASGTSIAYATPRLTSKIPLSTTCDLSS